MNELGIAGTFNPQPLGFTFPSPRNDGPILKTVSKITARTVAAITPIKIAPFVFVEYKIAIRIKPKINTITGHPTKLPPAPSSTGTGPDWVRRTNPASTKPIRAMNKPIPTEIASFN